MGVKKKKYSIVFPSKEIKNESLENYPEEEKERKEIPETPFLHCKRYVMTM